MITVEHRLSQIEQATTGREQIRVVPVHLEPHEISTWCAESEAAAAKRGERVVHIHTGVPRR